MERRQLVCRCTGGKTQDRAIAVKDIVRIGIIGCGRISDLHVRGYADCKAAVIHAVCDTSDETARKRREEWGAVKAYTDYRRLLEDPEVDAVDILTPHTMHERMVIASLQAGKPTAIQKPMTIDLAGADRMIAAAEQGGQIFKVTENYLFYPPIVKAAELIRSGAVGKPQNIRIHLLAGGSGGWEIPNEAWAWRMKEYIECRGMETFDHGHHLWSTAWFLMGGFKEVTAWIDTIEGMIDAPANIMWKHSTPGRYGSCTFSYGNNIEMPSDYYANDEWIEVTGSDGIIKINRCTGRLLSRPVLSLFDSRGWHHFEDIPSDWQEGFTGAAANFVEAVRGKQEPRLSGAEGRHILAMNLAIQKSARLQRSVFLDELEAPLPALRARSLRRNNSRALKRFRKDLLAESKNTGEDTGPAERAAELTLSLVDRIDMEKLAGWKARLGLDLTGDGQYSFIFDGSTLHIEEGSLPEEPDLLISVQPEVWAVLLLGKKKMQTAFLQGKLKLKGNLDYAFKLKEVLGF